MYARRAAGPKTSATASVPLSPLARAGASSGGQVLDRKTQNEMSARFGHDFSSVRIHADARAGESAQALGAEAYTQGTDIVFGEGKYQPGSAETERLLAHELTHVAQQERFGPGDPARASDRGDASEREAERASAEVAAGRDAQVRARPAALVSRSVPDDIGSLFGGVSRLAGGAAQLVGDGVSALAGPGAAQTGQGKLPAGLTQGKLPAGITAEGTVQAGSLSTWDRIYDAGRDYINEQEDEARPFVEAVDTGEKKVNEGITDAEDSEKAFTKSVVDEHPWLGPMAQDVDNATEFVGGAGRSVTDTTGGVLKTVADPWDTAEGVGKLAMHLNDPEYLKKTFVAPYEKEWAEGKYFDVAGHVFGDAVTMLAPGGEEAGVAARTGEEAGMMGRTANAGRAAGEGETLARESGAVREAESGASREAGAGARDPWASAGDPPAHEPPGGGGGPAGGGRGPQSIPEMIQEELDKAERAQPGFSAHPGAQPLDPVDFPAPPGSQPLDPMDFHDPWHLYPQAPPETWLTSPAGTGAPLESRPPAVPTEYETMVNTMTSAGMTPEEAAQTARELADAQEVQSGGTCKLSPEKQMQFDKGVGARKGRRY